MRGLVAGAWAVGTAVRLGVHRVIASAAKALLEAARRVLDWHRERMSSDPLYPMALAAGGGALIQVLVPSVSVAAVLRSVLQLLLGSSAPVSHDRGYSTYGYEWDEE